MPVKRIVKPILTLLLAVTISVAIATNAGGAEIRDPREFFFTLSFGDLPEELQLARDEDKLGMLLFFESESCSYCRYMLENVFNRRLVQDWYRQRFVSIAIDIHGDVEMKDFDGNTLPSKEFADKSNVFVTPVLSFLNLDGVEVFRHSGMIKTPDEFLLMGEYVAGGHYKKFSFKSFSRSRGLPDSGEALVSPASPGDRT